MKIFSRCDAFYQTKIEKINTWSQQRKNLNFSQKIKYLNEIDLAKESISPKILTVDYSVNKWSITSKFDNTIFCSSKSLR